MANLPFSSPYKKNRQGWLVRLSFITSKVFGWMNLSKSEFNMILIVKAIPILVYFGKDASEVKVIVSVSWFAYYFNSKGRLIYLKNQKQLFYV